MEYNINFQDNIPAEDFNERVAGIANWIEENRDQFEWAKDPNAYEMTNVFLFAGKHTQDGKHVDLSDVQRIWDMRSGDFEGCGISENNFVYQICKQSYDCAMRGEALVTDEASHSALRKMAGVGLYLMQQKRDQGKMNYNNLSELLALMRNSRALRQNHPDLYEGFKFDDNIRVLRDLQEPHLGDEAKALLDSEYNMCVGTQSLETGEVEEDAGR